jgi:transcription elongation GreA/GreB family factor
VSACLSTFDKPETREAFVLATMERSHFRLRAGEYDAAKARFGLVERRDERVEERDRRSRVWQGVRKST